MSGARHIHLVGSINYPTAIEALDAAATKMGQYLLRLPDGEPGPRRGWIFYQLPMFIHHNQLTQKVDMNTTQLFEKRVLRTGVLPRDLTFPELGYCREARLSYQDFKAAKASGRVPPDVRFQVSLPTPLACTFLAVAPEAMAAVEPAYEAAMLREVAAICAAIPHDELAVQWDNCMEMLWFDGRAFPMPWDDAANRARYRRLTGAVPADVHLGVHLCYGDLDGKHMVEPVDMAKLAGLANLITEEAARPLQWVHMPVPIARDDDAYFAPLADLRLHPETELFLGLIHLADGLDGARRRIRAAERHVKCFGIATECGIGRAYSPEGVRELFSIHAAAAAQDS